MGRRRKFNTGQIYSISNKEEFDVHPLSLDSIIENPYILDKLKSSNWSLEEKITFAYSFTHYYDKNFCGILYQDDKPGSVDFKGTFYKRLFRKQRNTSNFNQEISLIDAYRDLSDYRQVTIGPNLSSRQIFVVDVDKPFTWSEFDKIIFLCDNWKISLPSCIVINTKYNPKNNSQNHYQIMWILDKCFFSPEWKDNLDKRLYDHISDILTDIFGGDKNYKKLFAKNPYCTKGIDTLWIYDENNPYIDRDIFVEEIRRTQYEVEKTDLPIEGMVEDNNISIDDSNLTEEEIKCINWKDIYSRNVCALNATTKRCFQLKNKGENVNFNHIKELFIKYEYFVANITGKYNIESSRKINASCKGILNFLNKNYDPSFKKSSKYDNNDRESSSITKKYLEYGKRVLIEVYKKKGYSQNKISKENGKGYSKATISRIYNNISFNIALNKCKEAFNYFKNKELNSEDGSKRKEEARNNKLIIQFIINLYKTMIKMLNFNPNLTMSDVLLEKVEEVLDILKKKIYNYDIDLKDKFLKCRNIFEIYSHLNV